MSTPPAWRTLLLVGDSHLTDTSTREVWNLGPRMRACGWDVTTCAVGGLTTRAALELAEPDGFYDWSVFCFGSNDAAPWKGVPLPEFADNLTQLVMRASGRRVLLGPPPVSSAAEASGRTQDLINNYSEAAAQVAADWSAMFIALVEFLGQGDLSEDGVHLNDNGYAKIAECLIGVLCPEE